jgi:hypothetical protein
MTSSSYYARCFLLVLGLAGTECGGKAGGPRPGSEGGGQGGTDGAGAGETARPIGCREVQVDGDLAAPSAMPHRPFWVNPTRFHVVHIDRYLGIVYRTFSRDTGLELSVESEQVFPTNLLFGYWGIDAVAASPQGDLAVAFGYNDEGDRHEGILSVSGGRRNAWTPPWQEPFRAWGLGWDGDAFTVSLLDWDERWAAARFSPQGEMLDEVTVYGQGSVSFGYYDSDTDEQSGTTVFAGAAWPGVVVVGRRGHDSSLTAPSSYWHFSTDEGTAGWATALALNGSTALVATEEKDLTLREISLDTGELLATWPVRSDPEGDVYQQVAAARAGDRWIIVGQDYVGLVLAEIRNGVMSQRRLLRHPPAACAETATCGSSSDWRWSADKLSLAVDGDSAWAGVLDMTTQRMEGERTVFTYRILPLRDGCEYESLGKP